MQMNSTSIKQLTYLTAAFVFVKLASAFEEAPTITHFQEHTSTTCATSLPIWVTSLILFLPALILLFILFGFIVSCCRSRRQQAERQIPTQPLFTETLATPYPCCSRGLPTRSLLQSDDSQCSGQYDYIDQDGLASTWNDIDNSYAEIFQSQDDYYVGPHGGGQVNFSAAQVLANVNPEPDIIIDAGQQAVSEHQPPENGQMHCVNITVVELQATANSLSSIEPTPSSLESKHIESEATFQISIEASHHVPPTEDQDVEADETATMPTSEGSPQFGPTINITHHMTHH